MSDTQTAGTNSVPGKLRNFSILPDTATRTDFQRLIGKTLAMKSNIKSQLTHAFILLFSKFSM